MTTFGYLTVIKRNGMDGSKLPLNTSSCLIGRDEECDIRIQLPNVSHNHCRIDVLPNGEILLINLSNVNPTVVNGNEVLKSIMISHGDMFTISDRSFRWDFLTSSPYYTSKRKLPLSNGVSLAKVSSGKPRLSIESKTKKKSPSLNKTPSTISPAKKKPRLSSSAAFSHKKVSFGPALSPEQYELSLPVSTPIKKGGRPPSRRPSAPSFYGDLILTPMTRKKKLSTGNRSISNDSIKHSRDSTSVSTPLVNDNVNGSKTPESKTLPLMKSKSSSAKSKDSFVGKRKSKSMSPAARSGTKKDRYSFPASLSSAKKSSVRMLLGLENAVKIVAPASPDSKKSAALRTIHAGKLKLKRSKSTQYLNKRKKKSIHRHSLKVQMPFSRVSPTKKTKGVGKRSVLVAATNNLSSSPSAEYKSPNISKEVFISPLNTPRGESKSSAVKRFLGQRCKRSSRSSDGDSMNLSGIETLMQTPSSPQKSTIASKSGQKKDSFEKKGHADVSGLEIVRRTSRNSLKPDYSNKRLKRSPQKSPKSDYSDVRGVKRLMKSPAKSPKSDYSDVRGVKRLMKSPAKSPKSEYIDVFGLKRLMRTPPVSPKADYTDVKGVKHLLQATRKSYVADYSDVKGVDQLFRHSKSPRTSGSKRSLSVTKTPKSDLPTVTPAKRGSEGALLGFVQRSTRSTARTSTTITLNIGTPKSTTRGRRGSKKISSSSPLKTDFPSPTTENLPKTPLSTQTKRLDKTSESLERSIRSPVKRSPTFDAVRDDEFPVMKTPNMKTTPDIGANLIRSTRATTTSSKTKTPASVLAGKRGRSKSKSPGVVAMQSLTPSPNVKTPSSASTKRTHKRDAETPVDVVVTRKKDSIAITPDSGENLARSARATTTSSKTKTPASVVARKRGRSKSKSPGVVAMQSLTPSPNVKTPSSASTKRTHKRYAETPVEVVVTPKKGSRSPTTRSGIVDSIKDVESPVKKTPEFMGRITRSVKKTTTVKASPKVKTPKSVTRKRGGSKSTTPLLQSLSPSPSVKTSVSTSTVRKTRQTKNAETPFEDVVTPMLMKRGRKKKEQTTPVIKISNSPKITPKRTKTPRKAATKKVSSSPAKIEESIATTTRTRSKRVVFVDKSKSPVTPKPKKVKRGAARKSESESSPVIGTPSPVLSKRKATPKPKTAAKKTSTKAAVAVSPKTENVTSAKTKSSRAKKATVISPKTPKLRSPIMTRTSLRRKQ